MLQQAETLECKQRSYQRWLDKRIYKTEMKFWAVLGSRGCREKNCHKQATFLGVFSTFCGQKENLNLFLKYCNVRTKK
jgi:hypothetical protein